MKPFGDITDDCRALLFFHHIWASASDYAQFLGEYPYMWRQFWIIVLVDYLYVIQDICGWVTPSNVSFDRPP